MSEKSQKGIDRRSFLKGALATGAAAAAVTLPGCTPTAVPKGAQAGATKHTWDVPPAPITDIAEKKDFDIVIVGCGLAGLNAAQAASRNGARVACIERSEEFQIRGVDVGHIGSEYHKRTGFNVDAYTAAKFTHLWSHQTTNYNLIFTWASRSGKVFDYIEKLVAEYGVWMVPALSGTAKVGWENLPERWRIHPDA
ncbi:MAG: FAD-binding protein, partial [Coriobacteriales bacterium]|nr:FAD-binding protein [Coriobacteriales bacterium]